MTPEIQPSIDPTLISAITGLLTTLAGALIRWFELRYLRSTGKTLDGGTVFKPTNEHDHS